MTTRILESVVESYLIQEVKKLGGLCLKLTGYKGIPDRLVILPDGVVLFIELKRPSGGIYSKIQNYWHELLTKWGLKSLRAKDKEEIDNLLKEYSNGI